MKSKKGTSLWKSLFVEGRLPWRYKTLGLIRGTIYSINRFYNLNSKYYWNKKLNRVQNNGWREDVYTNLLKYLPKNKKFSLLDIGCALGDGGIVLKKNLPKAEISGCDFSEVGIGKAKHKTKQINFFLLDILKQNISKNYDYITLVSILEHFDNPFLVIDKCLKKVNNYLIVDCPYYEHISSNPKGEHRFSFNEKTLMNYTHNYHLHKNRITYLVYPKKMKKILFVIDRLNEGAGRVIYDLVKFLDKDKFESVVVSIYSNEKLVVDFNKLNVKIINLNKKPGKGLGIIFRLKRIIRKEKIDIVHVNNADAYEYGVPAAWLAGVRNIVVTMHGKTVKYGWFRKKREDFVNKFLSMFLDNFVVVSNDLGRYSAKKWCLNRNKIKTIYNGVDVNCYNKKKVKKKKDLMIGIVAGLRPVKNHACLIKAMKIVKEEVPNSKLLIVGDGPERLRLINLVNRLGLGKDVLFLGNRKDVIDWYSLFDVGVLPSFSECLSMTLLEGMACSVPFVATNVGGNPELIEDNVDGILVPVNDSFVLAEKIISLLKNKKLRQKIGRNARENVVNKFSVEKMIDSYKSVYL